MNNKNNINNNINNINDNNLNDELLNDINSKEYIYSYHISYLGLQLLHTLIFTILFSFLIYLLK